MGTQKNDDYDYDYDYKPVKVEATETKPERSFGNFKTKANTKVILILLGVILLLIVFFILYANIQKAKRSTMEAEYIKELLEAQEQAKEAEEEKALFVQEEVKVTIDTLKEIITPASELVAQKYYYTDVGVYTKDKTFFKSNVKIPFTTDETIYMYSGVINAGTTLDDIEFDINDNNKIITVSIPEPKILSHDFDNNSFKSYDRKNSVFTSSSLDDFNDFQIELKENEENKLNDNTEFWTHTKESIQTTISNLIKASGQVDDYLIDCKWVSN